MTSSKLRASLKLFYSVAPFPPTSTALLTFQKPLVAEKHDIPRHCVNRAINYLIHTHCEDVKVNFGLTDKTMSPSGIISSIALYIEHNYLNPVDISLDSDTDVDVAAEVAATTD